MVAALSANHLAALLFGVTLQRLYVVRDDAAAGDFALSALTERAAVALLAVTPVSRRAPLVCFGTDRERAIGPIACGRSAFLQSPRTSSSCRPSRLQPFLDQGGYLDGTTVGTAYERDRSSALFQLDRLSSDCRRRGLSHELR
jgi:hypothetical protein